jgi:hypothetical protein
LDATHHWRSCTPGRAYINFFQPSFSSGRTRDGTRVTEAHHPPAAPCNRLLDRAVVGEVLKLRLREQSPASIQRVWTLDKSSTID